MRASLLEKVLNERRVSIFKLPRWYDLPFMHRYVATKKSDPKIKGIGSSIESNTLAKLRCAGEYIERDCLASRKGFKLILSSFSKLKEQAIPFDILQNFSKEQIKDESFKKLICNREDKIRFVEGRDYFNNKEIFIPAQMVFVPFPLMKKEKILSLPISTGTAAGFSFEEAFLRSLLEVVERDAFIIHYLNNIFGKKINVNESEKLKSLKKYFEDYNLELNLFFLPSDIRVYNVMCILLDYTGIAPAVNCGLASGFHLEKTIIKSIEESLQSLIWIREEVFLNGFKSKSQLDTSLRIIKQRGFYWSGLENINTVKKWIKHKKLVSISKLENYIPRRPKNKLKYLINEITNAYPYGLNIYYIEITKDIFKKHGIRVIKSIVPQLQPLHLDEKFPYLGLPRLYNLPVILGYREKALDCHSLNKKPHFFL